MNKMIFENAYVLSASLRDDVKKQGDDFVPTGAKKIALTLLTDVVQDKLGTGEIHYITSVKEPNFSCEDLIKKLKRFEKVTVTADVLTFAGKQDYRFRKIVTSDGVDLTASAVLTPTDEPLPF